MTVNAGVLDAEMSEAIGAAKGERSKTRVSYRSGYYSRSLIGWRLRGEVRDYGRIANTPAAL